jgi:hypothetical protein
MDQRSMYESQSDPARAVCGDGYVLKGRDDFIIDYINRSVLEVSERKLDIAELSIGDGRLTMALLQSGRAIKLTCADISSTRIRLVSF